MTLRNAWRLMLFTPQSLRRSIKSINIGLIVMENIVRPESMICLKCKRPANRLKNLRFMYFCPNCLIHVDYKGRVYLVTPEGNLVNEERLRKEAEFKMAYGDKMKHAREVLPKEKFEQFLAENKSDSSIAADTGLDLWQIKKLKSHYGLVDESKNTRKRKLSSKTTGFVPVYIIKDENTGEYHEEQTLEKALDYIKAHYTLYNIGKVRLFEEVKFTMVTTITAGKVTV